ncbi:uncharacterized protein BDW43DRAFT_310179 [Aspergillus alliaceus]|uniref:uncharacterized protein n=1 Tax=Petromyces alliaceus TaxID=209559 RepID=UPI0012A454D9|nr:uncharacterized protein BDW43DRAFT_310179 [Aspergillus alliaceus]KAB8234516.1 hypothetical protein BDW43DRAFT_310179 [Aspergillus alliaceus]
MIYSSLLHFFWLGTIAPLITYAPYKLTKKQYWKYVKWPLIFTGTANVPPATGIKYSSWALVNFVFNYFIKRHFFAWWTKYNYILAAALDTGRRPQRDHHHLRLVPRCSSSQLVGKHSILEHSRWRRRIL